MRPKASRDPLQEVFCGQETFANTNGSPLTTKWTTNEKTSPARAHAAEATLPKRHWQYEIRACRYIHINRSQTLEEIKT